MLDDSDFSLFTISIVERLLTEICECIECINMKAQLMKHLVQNKSLIFETNVSIIIY